ncbi:MAG: SDR family oxidoreductase [Phycisphaerales bacterium]|nr:SDR family oxidoreductase [Phycisphaerales bacterium]
MTVTSSSPSPSLRHLITGAGGFLGSHLTDTLLAQGHHVTGIDNFVTGSRDNISHLQTHPNYAFIEHDLTKGLPEQLGNKGGKPNRFDRIWHLASPASPVGYVKHQVVTLKVNSCVAMQLLELAEAHKSRIFVASTSECYGDPLEHPQRETYWGHVNSVGMRSMYDEAKRFMEAATMAYHRERGVDTRIVRIFNTYGPRLAINDGRVVVAFITQALRNESLTVQGEGRQTRSLCYVEDEIRGFLALMDSDYHLPVNIGNPDEVTMIDLAKEIRELCNSKSQIIHTELPPDDPKLRCPDITLAKDRLKWTPIVSRREGLKRTIEFYRNKLGL